VPDLTSITCFMGQRVNYARNTRCRSFVLRSIASETLVIESNYTDANSHEELLHTASMKVDSNPRDVSREEPTMDSFPALAVGARNSVER